MQSYIPADWPAYHDLTNTLCTKYYASKHDASWEPRANQWTPRSADDTKDHDNAVLGHTLPKVSADKVSEAVVGGKDVYHTRKFRHNGGKKESMSRASATWVDSGAIRLTKALAPVAAAVPTPSKDDFVKLAASRRSAACTGCAEGTDATIDPGYVVVDKTLSDEGATAVYIGSGKLMLSAANEVLDNSLRSSSLTDDKPADDRIEAKSAPQTSITVTARAGKSAQTGERILLAAGTDPERPISVGASKSTDLPESAVVTETVVIANLGPKVELPRESQPVARSMSRAVLELGRHELFAACGDTHGRFGAAVNSNQRDSIKSNRMNPLSASETHVVGPHCSTSPTVEPHEVTCSLVISNRGRSDSSDLMKAVVQPTTRPEESASSHSNTVPQMNRVLPSHVNANKIHTAASESNSDNITNTKTANATAHSDNNESECVGNDDNETDTDDTNSMSDQERLANYMHTHHFRHQHNHLQLLNNWFDDSNEYRNSRHYRKQTANLDKKKCKDKHSKKDKQWSRHYQQYHEHRQPGKTKSLLYEDDASVKSGRRKRSFSREHEN
jgi:hypothetical protein